MRDLHRRSLALVFIFNGTYLRVGICNYPFIYIYLTDHIRYSLVFAPLVPHLTHFLFYSCFLLTRRVAFCFNVHARRPSLSELTSVCHASIYDYHTHTCPLLSRFPRQDKMGTLKSEVDFGRKWKCHGFKLIKMDLNWLKWIIGISESTHLYPSNE